MAGLFTMRNTALMLGSIAVTILGFGLYGPTLRSGQVGMATDGGVASLRPFVCVGLAYFLVGIIVPAVWLHLRGEKGEWTLSGVIWSIAGGALGAIGAFGIILASVFGGQPVYVMPLVFGGAPVVNAFLTIVMAGRLKEISSVFMAGLIIVVIGVVVLLLFRPYKHHTAPQTQTAAAESQAPQQTATARVAAEVSGGFLTWAKRSLAIIAAILSWGAYGPVLHRGQAAMHHSRLRPLICVGLAYLVIAVIVPYFFLGEIGENSSYARVGTLWSFLAGAFAACGALGIIMAFNWGGKPVFVMPLVFGGAPVVSTFSAVSKDNLWDDINPFFWAGLILVIAGSVMVLVLAPRGETSREPEPA
jgi:hypothetical protein